MTAWKGYLALAGVLVFVLAACSSTPSTSTASSPPGGGLVVNSDSIVTAQIRSISQQSSGYPWAVDILVQSSADVDALPNPVKDSVGKVITVRTDLDMSAYKAGEVITARVKYAGDVPRPGIVLYLYDIAPETTP